MSAETSPIDPVAFAQALESLPIETLHFKAAEIRNSVAHLKSSNEQLMPFADDGDQDCREAMFENLVVIGRMNQRVAFLRAEVERRGMRWADAEVEDADAAKDQPTVNGEHSTVNSQPRAAASGAQERASSGRLTDDELRARMTERMGEDDDSEGVHL